MVMSNRPETVVRYAAGSLPLAASRPSFWGNQRPARPFRHPPEPIPYCQGFSLLEVLVAVIVLAVGLLGIAGLQVAVLKANDGSRLRSLATVATYDLIDRIRADPTALSVKLTAKIAIPPGQCAASTAATDPLTRWYRDFCAVGLPPPLNAQSPMTIDCTSGNGCGQGNCKITVLWDDSRATHKGEPKTNTAFSVCTRLPIP
jgi:type IV pilus assembly protein PilV